MRLFLLPPACIGLFLLAIGFALRGTAVVEARVGSVDDALGSDVPPFLNDDTKPNTKRLQRRRRSLAELSSEVHRELSLLTKGDPFGTGAITAAARSPHTIKRLHRLLVLEGASEEGELDNASRELSLEALRNGIKSWFDDELGGAVEEIQRSLRRKKNGNNSRSLQEQPPPPPGNSVDLEEIYQAVKVFWKVLKFIISFLVGTVITEGGRKLVTGFTPPPAPAPKDWSFELPTWLTGISGSQMSVVEPCNEMPLNPDEYYGYLPIMKGLYDSLTASVEVSGDGTSSLDTVVDDMLGMMDVNQQLSTAEAEDPSTSCIESTSSDTCEMSSDCCGSMPFLEVANQVTEVPYVATCDDEGQCIQGNLVKEMFCLLWSGPMNSETRQFSGIDTIGFKPIRFWPPVSLVVLGEAGGKGRIDLLPNCPRAGDGECKHCTYYHGIPGPPFTIRGVKFIPTVAFNGFAVSWADQGRLTYRSSTTIWDGFRDIPLPTINGMNFWLSFYLFVRPYDWWKLEKKECEKIKQIAPWLPKPKRYQKKSFALEIQFDLYVAAGDRSTTSEWEATIGEGLAGEEPPPESTRNLHADWRKLTSHDSCVIMTAQARITLSFFGEIGLGDLTGGYCTFEPEPSFFVPEGTRCTPSGFFLNLDQGFTFEGGVIGLLGTILEGIAPDLPEYEQASGNSFGVFQDANGDTEAVVLRLEVPNVSIFGVSLGSGTPAIHFQFMKGSEVERRRQTLLRQRTNLDDNPEDGSGAYCNDVRLECEEWAPFDQHKWDETGIIEICRSILIPSTYNDYTSLLYYNRVLTADIDTTNDDERYLITPPSGSAFKTPSAYDFESPDGPGPDADVVILYMAIADIGTFIIKIAEISITLIISEGPPPPYSADVADNINYANSLYDDLDSDAKDIWRPPSSYYFPSLQDYEGYLPVAQGTDPTEAELDTASIWNEAEDEARSYYKKVYIRLFCRISVLEFQGIDMGFIMTNYADDDPNRWYLIGQFEAELFGFVSRVAAWTTVDFDRRRHRHLEGDEYHRALANDGLQGADYSVRILEVSCTGVCEAVLEFFEDVGEAIYAGIQRIGEFFTEDIVEFAAQAVAILEDWGEKFADAIVAFANEVKDIFTGGEVGKLMEDPLVTSFDDNAVLLFEGLSDGLTLQDAVAAGKLVLQGLQIADAYVKAVFKNIGNAILTVFANIGTCWVGATWTEYRMNPYYSDPLLCLEDCRAIQSNPEFTEDERNKNCWCVDEFECPVKNLQQRTVRQRPNYGFGPCFPPEPGSWGFVPLTGTIEIEKDTYLVDYPRWIARAYDEACRTERIAKMAEGDDLFDDMKETAHCSDDNFENKFNGMTNWSPSNRRRRRLQGSSAVNQVNSVSFADIDATDDDGNLLSIASASGSYSGTKLSKDSLATPTVQDEGMVHLFDFSAYDQLSSDPIPESATADQVKVGALGANCEDLDMDDRCFFDRQPIVPAPRIDLAAGSNGISSNPVELSCSGELAHLWSTKLSGAEPEVLRRRRARRLNHRVGLETAIEFPAEQMLRDMILDPNGGIDIIFSIGTNLGTEDDIFFNARELCGDKGFCSFLDVSGSSRRKLLFDPQDYTWSIKVQQAQPLCDRLAWVFDVTARDSTGVSNILPLHAHVLYGEARVNESPPTIQTRCPTTPFGVNDLEENHELQTHTGLTTFTPKIKTDNCPSPFLIVRNEPDVVTHTGTPCSTDYMTVERRWVLDIHDPENHPGCTAPNTTADFPFIQVITLGGGTDQNGVPDTPVVELQDQTYYLPSNELDATVQPNPLDFFYDDNPPHSECGLCGSNSNRRREQETSPADSDFDFSNAIIFSHSQGFTCRDEGNNTISIAVRNSLGIETTQTATATVVVPSKIARVCPTVFYPDWARSNKGCIVDGNQPQYMYHNPSLWMYETLESCCKEHYNYNLAECLGQSKTLNIGLYYPKYLSSGHYCSNDGKQPKYMNANSQWWMHQTIEACCKQNFNWNYGECVAQGRHDPSSISDAPQAKGTGKWYVIWKGKDSKCVQDCDGEAPCGGHAKFWQELYATKATCCERRLPWVDKCVDM